MKGFFGSDTGILNDDLYVLIEINLDDIVKTNPMSYDMLWKYIVKKYEDQPLKYFNETQRLRVVHLKSGLIKTLRLTLEAV
jgi:hypothetical protein